jgi:hypothetical protein
MRKPTLFTVIFAIFTFAVSGLVYPSDQPVTRGNAASLSLIGHPDSAGDITRTWLTAKTKGGDYFHSNVTNMTWMPDCAITSIEKISDDGYSGIYRISLDFSRLQPGKKFVMGATSLRDATWKKYPLNEQGQFEVEWANGYNFEFSFGTTDGGIDSWFNPRCSSFLYPLNADPETQHFRVKLGSIKKCSIGTINDKLITSVQNLGNNNHLIYFDPTRYLPMLHYQKVFVMGESAPGDAWIEYAVADNYPCFAFLVHWPDSATLFKFSFGVIAEGGTTEWVDPTLSKFSCDNNLCINFTE